MKPRYALAGGAIVAVVATGALAQESLDVVEVLRQSRRFSYQARELDVQMPGLDGFEVLRALPKEVK